MALPAHQRLFVSIHAAADLVEGRRAEVIRLLRAAGLVKTIPGLGERVSVPAMMAWWEALGQGEAAEASPAVALPPRTVDPDVRIGGLGLGRRRRVG